MFLPPPSLVKIQYCGSIRDREVVCSASDRKNSNFESCVWRSVSSHSSHHLREVLLVQFSLYVHKGGLKPHSSHFIYFILYRPITLIIYSVDGSTRPWWYQHQIPLTTPYHHLMHVQEISMHRRNRCIKILYKIMMSYMNINYSLEYAYASILHIQSIAF